MLIRKEEDSYNAQSGVSAWLDEDKELSELASEAAEQNKQPEALPNVSEWKSALDPVTGKRYSYNTAGETKWIDE